MARLLVALICLVPLPRVLAGQVDTATKDTIGLGARVSFSLPPFALREPPTLRAPWLGAQRAPPLIRGMAWDTTVAAVLDSARQDRARALRYLVLYGEPVREPLPDAREAPPSRNGVLGLSKKYADLALDGQVRLEVRTDRLRNERCSAAQLQNPNAGCRGGFKAPRLDNEVNVSSSGIIGRRVHLAIDYDTERDFSANNNVQVYYQGLEDEIIRRIEVGTVTFQPPPPASSPPPSRPTTSASMRGSKSGRCSFRPSLPLRKAARWPSVITRWVRLPASHRTGSFGILTSNPAGSSGW